jgi:Glycosyl hydrolases family 11
MISGGAQQKLLGEGPEVLVILCSSAGLHATARAVSSVIFLPQCCNGHSQPCVSAIPRILLFQSGCFFSLQLEMLALSQITRIREEPIISVRMRGIYEERIMNKKWLIKAAMAAALITGTAYAANHTSNGEGTDGSTFWTVFKQDTNSGGINVTDGARRAFTLTWDNKDVDSADFATGGGFKDVNRPNNVFYSITKWSISRTGSNGSFGVYGWSCPSDQGIKIPGTNTFYDNVEFYVTESSINGQQFVPYDTTFKKDVLVDQGFKKANGSIQYITYKIYESPVYRRANACRNQSNGQAYPFKQVWAVRQGNRSVGTSAVTLDFKKLSEVMDDYGYFTYNLRYLVVGIDAFRNTKGEIGVGPVSIN